jgi:pyruvate,water dikinase
VRCGIDSISVNNDAVVRTRQLVASLEQKILLERLSEMREKGLGRAPKRTKQTESEWAPEWEE